MAVFGIILENWCSKLFTVLMSVALLHAGVADSLRVKRVADSFSADDDECIGRDQCSCQYSDGTLVDLSSVGNSDLTPKFKDVVSQDGNKYSYNPCYPFNEGQCDNVAVCMLDSVGTETELGDPQDAKFQSSDGGVSIGYQAGSGILTLTEVVLQCDLTACTPTLDAPGLQTPSSYQLIMTSACACKDGCDANGPKDQSQCKSNPSSASSVGGIGIGGLILIIFFTFALLYFVGGAVFLKFGRKATGTEVIPNYSVWRATPGLVKDGMRFTMTPILGRGSYTRI